MALLNVLGTSLLVAAVFLAGSALVEVASPYAITIWATISAGLLGAADGVVEGWLATLCVTYQTHFTTASRHLTTLGLPVRVLVKCILAPLLIAHLIGHSLMHGADYYPYAPDPHSLYPQKILAGRYLCISVLAVGLSQFQQPIWTPPANLAMKPVTVGLLLIPCVLGWTMHDLAGGWLVKDIETGHWTLHDSLKTPTGGWWKHRDRHFACAAIAYNVWLASRGPDGILTARSLESGYGAAKILLLVHILVIAWAMIPAEHWPL